MRFNLADLNKRITIQRPAKTADGSGGFTVSWTDVKEVWAAIWPVSAKTLLQDNQTVGEISHRIRIRFRRGVSTANRIKYKSRYFSILGLVNPDEDNEWLDILCKEVG